MVNGTATLQYDDTDLAGAYGVSVPGESAGGAYRFAVQPDTRESQLAELGPAQIEGLAPMKVVRWTPATQLEGRRRGRAARGGILAAVRAAGVGLRGGGNGAGGLVQPVEVIFLR